LSGRLLKAKGGTGDPPSPTTGGRVNEGLLRPCRVSGSPRATDALPPCFGGVRVTEGLLTAPLVGERGELVWTRRLRVGIRRWRLRVRTWLWRQVGPGRCRCWWSWQRGHEGPCTRAARERNLS